jgi:hypothetical protein
MNCSKNRKSVIAIYISILMMLIPFLSLGQTSEILVTGKFSNLSLKEFSKKLETNYHVRLYYQPDSIPEININDEADKEPLDKFLFRIFEPYKLNYTIDNYGNIFITRTTIINGSLPSDFFQFRYAQEQDDDTLIQEGVEAAYLQTAKEYVARTITIGTKKKGLNITKATITGFVTSTKDGAPIIGGTLYIEETETGTSTNDKGYFNFSIKKGKYTLIVNSIESKEEKFKIDVLSDGQVNFMLEPNLYLLDEVEVRSDKNHNVKGTQMGFEKITAKSINEIPMVLGEKDVVKVALLLPGVQSVGEGSSGFNVRGSPADQNLFYIDKVPVYNTSHLFGFFSSFNPDVISEFNLYKSNIPAKYGGRLSSIFDISAKRGNQKQFSARGGISPITGRLLVEGPIVNEKSSYLIGLRSTYSDWILRLVKDPDIRNSSAGFADAVANFSVNVSPKDQVKLFSYFSYDQADLSGITKNNYQNNGLALSWYHTYHPRLDMNLSLVYSKYAFEEKNEELEIAAYKQAYDLMHNEAKLDFEFKVTNKHNVTFGLNSILYHLDNGQHEPLNENSLIVPVELGKEQGLESGIYINDEWKVLPKLTLAGGVRYNIYSYLGPNDVFMYPENAPRLPESIVDTLTYGNNAIIKTYDGFDFRFAANYMLNDQLSLKASYNTLHQYIFMLSNTIAVAPTDKWKLSDYNIDPMKGEQISLGIYTNIWANYFELSLEAYVKNVKNLVEYKDGANFIVNDIPETDVIQGDLDSYGIEFMFRKPYGKLNGWFNYTYSKASVVVDNKITGENNNFGLTYPANYDKPHAFNIVANYKVTKRISFSGNVVYSTGRPISYPTAIYYQDGIKLLHYSLRNEFRLPDYFRVDASMMIEGNLKKKKFLHGSWVVSVYNLTGRKNAYSVFFKLEDGKIKGYKLSIFGTPIFSISYNFKLGNYDN